MLRVQCLDRLEFPHSSPNLETCGLELRAELRCISSLSFGLVLRFSHLEAFLVFANLNILINVNVFSHPNLTEFYAIFLDNFDNMRFLPLPATLKSNLLIDMPYSTCTHTHMHIYTRIHTCTHTLNGH